ncbi:hypothetical protein FHS32_000665 [Streptomyces albaduncus]|uniref:Uncharacterized protein n=1 Tax=Streptomyces griseoloalbus TaxID=67303 RepID=A0A7W8BIF4_9ACTN|nr:hypothetical protein [Streptomyces albaduncus]
MITDPEEARADLVLASLAAPPHCGTRPKTSRTPSSRTSCSSWGQRGLDVSDDVRSRITGCIDSDLLRCWLARAVTVPKAEEIFEGE